MLGPYGFIYYLKRYSTYCVSTSANDIVSRDAKVK